MALNKSKGQMYNWVTHTHSHLAGACSHACSYCFVQAMAERFPAMKARYTGPLRLIEDEFKVNYGSCKTIFVEHMNDLFAEDVPDKFIKRIMNHCQLWPGNTYVFQTKNPKRYLNPMWVFPENTILGTTIETNRIIPNIGSAPIPYDRTAAMIELRRSWPSFRRFVTIEPALDFDVEILAGWIEMINPEFVNIGADSKNRNLPEPTVEKVMALVDKLREYGIELREKHNLQRLKQK